jgi:hypothetical protein
MVRETYLKIKKNVGEIVEREIEVMFQATFLLALNNLLMLFTSSSVPGNGFHIPPRMLRFISSGKELFTISLPVFEIVSAILKSMKFF